MKINTTEEKGKEGVRSLIELTNGKETQKEKNKRIREEILKEVFKE